MAAVTGNAYISETVWGTVKIPKTYLGYKTMYRWKIVLVSKYNSDRQPEISIWPPKPEIITSLELWQIATNFQRQSRDFRWWQARQKISQMIATTIDYQKLQDWRPQRLYCCFRLSVVVVIARSQFLALGVVENPRFAIGIVIHFVIVPEI